MIEQNTLRGFYFEKLISLNDFNFLNTEIKKLKL